MASSLWGLFIMLYLFIWFWQYPNMPRPQADADFRGEEGWQQHPHRFKGLWDSFRFALHGPAEQAIPLVSRLDGDDWPDVPGLSYKDRNGGIIQHPKRSWDEKYLVKV